DNGDKRLVAYIVERQPQARSKEGKSSSENLRQWRQYVQAKLPEYMVPSAFVILDRLPLTANGKLDRRALPDPGKLNEWQAESQKARTPLEEILVGIWEQVLQLDGIGIEDNFFELGGHSLLATQ